MLVNWLLRHIFHQSWQSGTYHNQKTWFSMCRMCRDTWGQIVNMFPLDYAGKTVVLFSQARWLIIFWELSCAKNWRIHKRTRWYVLLTYLCIYVHYLYIHLCICIFNYIYEIILLKVVLHDFKIEIIEIGPGKKLWNHLLPYLQE